MLPTRAFVAVLELDLYGDFEGDELAKAFDFPCWRVGSPHSYLELRPCCLPRFDVELEMTLVFVAWSCKAVCCRGCGEVVQHCGHVYQCSAGRLQI